MKKRIVIDKKIGETPLMAIRRWKKANPRYADVTACYAGRLDPMASGKLLVLLGEECKKQNKYTSLDKQYDVELVFDVGSDSGDALGIVAGTSNVSHVSHRQLIKVVLAERGTHRRAYPMYSSKTVDGKPLFMHALEGTIQSINIPVHDEKIYSISIRSLTQVDASQLEARIHDYLTQVPLSGEPSKQLGADFRISAVTESWRLFFELSGQRKFVTVSLRVNCGSGTYMRSLAARIGEACGTRALALSISRTKIGKCWNSIWITAY